MSGRNTLGNIAAVHAVESRLLQDGCVTASEARPPQPPLEVVEAALDVAQFGEELERVLPADSVPGAGADMAIERRSCSTSRRRSHPLTDVDAFG